LSKTTFDIFEVSKEFIDDSKKIPLKNKKKKKGGPYTISERDKRRNEVFRLHFEYGYSARKIADMMKISRSTINADISFWFEKTVTNWQYADPRRFVIKTITRLDVQRTRLRESLDKISKPQEKNQIEKLIFEIDSKILQVQMKIVDSSLNINERVTKGLNYWMKEFRSNKRFLSYLDVYAVSQPNMEKIKKIRKDEEKRPI